MANYPVAAWVNDLTEARRLERHKAGVSFERSMKFKVWMYSASSAPVFISLCSLIPPIGISYVVGGTIAAFILGNTGDILATYHGYLIGVRRWDIANGFEAFPTYDVIQN